MTRALRLIAIVLVVCLFPAESASAKGGRGKGGGKPKGRAGMTRTKSMHTHKHRADRSRPHFQKNWDPRHRTTDRGFAHRPRGRSLETGRSLEALPGPGRHHDLDHPRSSDDTWPLDRRRGTRHAIEVQRRNEQRKLDHRLSVAERLRENARRNGNSNLLATADRMERRAYEHYDRRLTQIAGKEIDLLGRRGDEPSWIPYGNDALDPLASQPGGDSVGPFAYRDDPTATSPLETWQNGSAQPERQRLLDTARRLREVASQNGDASLLQTAERIETLARTPPPPVSGIETQ